ncbi:hypothetical protein [Breznakia pachnodae]|uniref:Uncharacterized protein n=1 Tax=Breznakia pachnodae TaxID=265178 RepID=A0ABU0DZC5_9FIRM|nr:hypothetical protein [Breznakia pachnodae]MDQ0359988.1 hypothetical protein [Breznakia pachnodae]
MNILEKLKHPKQIIRKDKESIKDYLLEKSVDEIGIWKHEDGYVISKDKERYKVFKITYSTPNGVNRDVDIRNHKNMRLLMDSLQDNCKVLFPKEQKNSLTSNIEFYMEIAKTETDPSRQEVLLNRIRLMNIWNETKYVSLILFIKASDEDKFKKSAYSFLNVREYVGDELIEFLSTLHNGME